MFFPPLSLLMPFSNLLWNNRFIIFICFVDVSSCVLLLSIGMWFCPFLYSNFCMAWACCFFVCFHMKLVFLGEPCAGKFFQSPGSRAPSCVCEVLENGGWFNEIWFCSPGLLSGPCFPFLRFSFLDGLWYSVWFLIPTNFLVRLCPERQLWIVSVDWSVRSSFWF